MKRFLALALILLISISLVGCSDDKDDVTLVVGSSFLRGDFIPGFGTNPHDEWVKTLLYEFYSLYVLTDVGEIVLNETVVKNQDIVADGEGNKTYTFEIHPDLKWNNGEPILAQDYVFALLWSASMNWEYAGASSTLGEGLLGYLDYREGTRDRFAGVQLLDKYKFSLTIEADASGFFETSYLTIYPLPLACWAAEAKIDSSPGGAQLISENPKWTLDFDTWRIAQTQHYVPTVTSGPYSFESFANCTVTLKANPYFKSDYKGRKPQVDYVVISKIDSYDFAACSNGEVDALTDIDVGYSVEEALLNEAVDVAYHPRNGFGGMYFHCDFGPVQHKEVRLALAYLLDRQEITENNYYGGALRINGLYGMEQWMYIENKAAIDALPGFDLDVAKANDLLDQSPYRFEADGKTPFDAARATADGDYYRHSAQGERLVINHLEVEDGGGLMQFEPIPSQLLPNAPLAGIDWQLHVLAFNSILDHFYYGPTLPEGERLYHSFYLSVNLSAVFDPYLSYHSESENNIVRISDPELDEIMEKMRKLDPQAKNEFAAEWVKFQTRWNQVLPVAPLVSNVYCDVFRKEVSGFYTTSFTSWADNICGITKGE